MKPSLLPLPSFPPVPPWVAQGQPGAAELARRLRDGEVSAVEIVETHIRRIEEVDPHLGAIVVRRFDEARREAEAADAARRAGAPLGPLHGLPITIKESFDLEGTPTTLGLDGRRHHRAAADAAPVAALRRAGAIVLGKTNVSQLLMGNETVNPLYGRTANPWDTARSPGGSSGGEAALIAAGGAAGGLGSDIGGSVRLPAHATGIAALKPTSTRLSMRGHASLYPGQEAILAQPGPMAREVADLALLFRVLVTSEEAGTDPTVPPVAHRDPARVRIEGLRVAMYDDNGLLRPAPALRRAISEAAEALRAAGAIVEPWTPPDATTAYYLYYGLLVGDGLVTAREALGQSLPSPSVRRMLMTARLPSLLLRLLAALLDLGGQPRLAALLRTVGMVSTRTYWQRVEERASYRERFFAALDAGPYDLILCPPDALPALPHDLAPDLADALSYPTLYNLLGLPAGVVPVTRVRPGEESDRPPSRDRILATARTGEVGSAGLPVGVQIAGRPFREDVVLAAMAVIEQATASTFGRSPATAPP